jgi:hypothetical protein
MSTDASLLRRRALKLTRQENRACGHLDARGTCGPGLACAFASILCPYDYVLSARDGRLLLFRAVSASRPESDVHTIPSLQPGVALGHSPPSARPRSCRF